MRLMSEDKFPGAVALLALLAVLASMLVMTAYLNETVSLQAHWRSRVAALSLSDRLRQTSDDLTRMVRLYAVNGTRFIANTSTRSWPSETARRRALSTIFQSPTGTSYWTPENASVNRVRLCRSEPLRKGQVC